MGRGGGGVEVSGMNGHRGAAGATGVGGDTAQRQGRQGLGLSGNVAPGCVCAAGLHEGGNVGNCSSRLALPGALGKGVRESGGRGCLEWTEPHDPPAESCFLCISGPLVHMGPVPYVPWCPAAPA